MISSEFIQELKSGYLKPLLDCVIYDTSLVLAIRMDYINIYYRGGSILKLTDNKDGSYSAEFDNNYFKYADSQKGFVLPECTIAKPVSAEKNKIEEWIEIFPVLKNAMNAKFKKHGTLEKEFQQLVVRENNFISKIAGKTDYFIADVETQTNDKNINNKDKDSRFDLIALKWPRGDRKPRELQLAFIEMKYGNDSLGSGKDGENTKDAGIVAHINDFEDAVKKDDNFIKNVATMALGQLFCLAELGLVPLLEKENISGFKISEERPEFIFILANHDPRSTKLRDILDGFHAPLAGNKYDLRFFNASSAGYGLYKECMFDLERYKDLLTNYV